MTRAFYNFFLRTFASLSLSISNNQPMEEHSKRCPDKEYKRKKAVQTVNCFLSEVLFINSLPLLVSHQLLFMFCHFPLPSLFKIFHQNTCPFFRIRAIMYLFFLAGSGQLLLCEVVFMQELIFLCNWNSFLFALLPAVSVFDQIKPCTFPACRLYSFPPGHIGNTANLVIFLVI